MDYVKYSEFMAASYRASEAYEFLQEIRRTGNDADIEAAQKLFDEAIVASNKAYDESKKSW